MREPQIGSHLISQRTGKSVSRWGGKEENDEAIA